MTYVFDTSSLSTLKHFYPNIFKSVWVGLDALIQQQQLISTREVWNEIVRGVPTLHVNDWLNDRKDVFTTPSPTVSVQTPPPLERVYRHDSMCYHQTPPDSAGGSERLRPTELQFVATIFQNPHFHGLISKKQLLRGDPVADPFVIACAKVRGGTVVTEERLNPNGARIPNVCEHFNVSCINLEKFMDQQKWSF